MSECEVNLKVTAFVELCLIPGKGGGECGLLPETLILYLTKIFNPYPTYDLTKNSIPYL